MERSEHIPVVPLIAALAFEAGATLIALGLKTLLSEVTEKVDSPEIKRLEESLSKEEVARAVLETPALRALQLRKRR